MIEHLLDAHGVDAATPVVVYDEQSGIRAARAFWFLEYFGHRSRAAARRRVRRLDARGPADVTREAAAAAQERVDRHARQDARIATWRDVQDRARQARHRDPRHAQ